MTRIAAIGEVMIELSPYLTAQEETREIKALSFAGDTYNTAVYMARLGVSPSYATALGDDPYSDQILQNMRAEGIGTEVVARVAERNPGLLLIHNSSEVQLAFYYCRRVVLLRELFVDPT